MPGSDARERAAPAAWRCCARGPAALRLRPAPPPPGRPGRAPPRPPRPRSCASGSRTPTGPEANRAVRPGRQHVVRAGHVVADRLRAERAEERRAGMADAWRTPPPDRASSSAGARAPAGRRVAPPPPSPAPGSPPHAARQLAAAIAARGRVGSSAATAAATASARPASSVIRIACAALVVLGLRQQIDRDPARVVVRRRPGSTTSDGPAILSMPTRPNTCRLASAT